METIGISPSSPGIEKIARRFTTNRENLFKLNKFIEKTAKDIRKDFEPLLELLQFALKNHVMNGKAFYPLYRSRTTMQKNLNFHNHNLC